MRRALALATLTTLLAGCPPPEEGFEFTLRLNLAGDEGLLESLDSIEIDMFYTDGTQHQESWDYFALDSALTIEQVPRGESVFFRVRGMADSGNGMEEIAVGESDAVDLPGTDEIWVLFHRHGALLDLEYGGDVPRMGHEVLAIPGGAVVLGGESGEGEYADIYKLVRTEKQGYALEVASGGPSRSGFASAVFPAGPRQGQILIAGGGISLGEFTGVQDNYGIWDPVSEEYTEVNLPLTDGRLRGRAVPVTDPNGDGHVVLIGGIAEETGNSVYFNDRLEVVHSGTTVTDFISLAGIRWASSAVTWGPTETVISCGGWDDILETLEAGDGCDEYYVASHSHTRHDEILLQPRGAHASVVVQINEDMKILLIGGADDDVNFQALPLHETLNSTLATAELVDPAHQYSTQLVDMAYARVLPLALRFPDERRVLVCGGHDGAGLRSDCEYFDELSQSFSLAGDISLPVPANDVKGAVLEDGSALIVGGNAGDYTPAAFALIYLP